MKSAALNFVSILGYSYHGIDMVVFHTFVCIHRSNQNSGVKTDPSILVLTYTEGENDYELLDDSQFLYPETALHNHTICRRKEIDIFITYKCKTCRTIEEDLRYQCLCGAVR